MNFELPSGKLNSGGKFLQPGIHTATFKGVDLQTIKSSKTGEEYSVMAVTFDIEGYGEWTHNIFPPASMERTESQWGENPSQFEQFTTFVRHLISVANPSIDKKIENKEIEFKAPNFEKFVKLVQKYTAEFVEESTKIKLIPQRNGFSSFPGFPAKVGKNGEVYLTTKFIGDDITLTANEMKTIENVRTAAPTQMKPSVKDMAADFGSEDDSDDLPF